MTTAREVFAIAMALLDELNERTGLAETNETRDYGQRTPAIINLLAGELYPYSDTRAAAEPGRRSVCPPVTALEDTVALDDYLCRSVLPCGLAARLVLDENPSVASFYERRYNELLSQHVSRLPAVFESIPDVYGGLRVDGGEVGTWL